MNVSSLLNLCIDFIASTLHNYQTNSLESLPSTLSQMIYDKRFKHLPITESEFKYFLHVDLNSIDLPATLCKEEIYQVITSNRYCLTTLCAHQKLFTKTGLLYLREFVNLQELTINGVPGTGTTRYKKNTSGSCLLLEVTVLKNLRKLTLTHCELTDLHMKEINCLFHLEYLDIGGNTLITHKGFFYLKDLTSLTSLLVWGTNFSLFHCSSYIPQSLTTFVLTWTATNDIDMIYLAQNTPIASNLTRLLLSQCQILNPIEFIRFYPNLIDLDFSGCDLSLAKTSFLKDLKHLKILNISGTELKTNITSFISSLYNEDYFKKDLDFTSNIHIQETKPLYKQKLKSDSDSDSDSQKPNINIQQPLYKQKLKSDSNSNPNFQDVNSTKSRRNKNRNRKQREKVVCSNSEISKYNTSSNQDHSTKDVISTLNKELETSVVLTKPVNLPKTDDISISISIIDKKQNINNKNQDQIQETDTMNSNLFIKLDKLHANGLDIGESSIYSRKIFSSLVEVSFSPPNLENVDFLQELRALKKFRFCFPRVNVFKDIISSFFQNLPTCLENLDLSNSYFDDSVITHDMFSSRNTHKITILSLNNTKDITDKFLQFLCHMPILNTLKMAGTNISDWGINFMYSPVEALKQKITNICDYDNEQSEQSTTSQLHFENNLTMQFLRFLRFFDCTDVDISFSSIQNLCNKYINLIVKYQNSNTPSYHYHQYKTQKMLNNNTNILCKREKRSNQIFHYTRDEMMDLCPPRDVKNFPMQLPFIPEFTYSAVGN